jgi:hypothetical protein
VSSCKVGGIFVHKTTIDLVDGKLLFASEEGLMSSQHSLPTELEAKAQALAAQLRTLAEEDLLALARLLVSKEDRELFGDTEFAVRDIVHGLGAKAYQALLAEKKTATTGRASSVPTASKAPSSTPIGTKSP